MLAYLRIPLLFIDIVYIDTLIAFINFLYTFLKTKLAQQYIEEGLKGYSNWPGTYSFILAFKNLSLQMLNFLQKREFIIVKQLQH